MLSEDGKEFIESLSTETLNLFLKILYRAKKEQCGKTVNSECLVCGDCIDDKIAYCEKLLTIKE
jgi:hypothetical protein